MTVSQDQFRAAIREAADEVTEQDIPPLSLPQFGLAGQHGARRLWASKRLLAPLAAAVAVTAVIATSVAVSGRGSHPAWPNTRTGAPIHLDRSGIPPYYLVNSPTTSEAEIRDTATGAPVATVRLPGPSARLLAATGAADNWTFVLAVYDWKDLVKGRMPLKYYLARFNPGTRRVTLQRLPIPSPTGDWLQEGLALSPNGRELAIAQLHSANNRYSVKVSVYSLTTGQVQVWQASSRYQIFNGEADLSWSSAGMLAFNAFASAKASGVWLLNTATAGGSLFSDSRLAVSSYQRAGFAQAFYGLLTPDGKTIVMPVFHRTNTGVVTHEFQTFSAATGKLLHVLLPRTSSKQNGFAPEVYWTSANGDTVIVFPGIGKRTYLELRGDRATTIPDMQSPVF